MQESAERAETNRRAAQKIFDVWDGQYDASALDDVMAEDVVLRGFPEELRGVSHGRDAYKGGLRMIRSAFPDLFFRADEIVVEDDKLMAYCTHGGTHEGELMGIEPTGKSFEAADFVLYRFEDGKVVEVVSLPDIFSMLAQLGIIESPVSGPGSP